MTRDFKIVWLSLHVSFSIQAICIGSVYLYVVLSPLGKMAISPFLFWKILLGIIEIERILYILVRPRSKT